MESFGELQKSGTFTVSEEAEIHGDLILKGAESKLDLYAKEFFRVESADGCILGALHDRTKVSLIDCVTTTEAGHGMRAGESFHFSSIFPHFVVFGAEHITSVDEKITEVSFHVDDANFLFYDFDAFGRVKDAHQHMGHVVNAARENGKEIVLGDYPRMFYFTGKHVIFEAETTLGTVSAEHRPSYSTPGPGGIRVDNKIYVKIAFKDQVTIHTAIASTHTLLRFLEVIAGRPQSIRRLLFSVPAVDNNSNTLDVYWSMAPTRTAGVSDHEPHPSDLPIQAAQEPEHFAALLTAWLARDDEWRNARFRFSAAFEHQRSFTIDRLVGAANMFDILPSSAVPSDVPLSKEVEDARTAARTLFKALPANPERDSVLNALGRLGKASLKRKVQARAKVIIDRLPILFPELTLVVDEAIDCRNYFVHGSKAKLDYDGDFDQVVFFTEALEFIFAASDLTECGWKVEKWSTQASTLSHPFHQFRHEYDRRLKDLKQVLATAKLAMDESPASSTKEPKS